jgi:uncharacterized protein (TIGR04255 family)
MKPEFDNPPVVERVIGVQFAELPFFTSAHAGWYWKRFLGDEWSQVNVAPKIQDQFEKFGKVAPAQKMRFEVSQVPTPERTQFVRASDDRMIQLQNSRFLLNWRKAEGQPYPEFKDLYAEFLDLLATFRDFVKEACGEELKINQWEITYVNHIPSDTLWKGVKDWPNLFPELSMPGMGHADKNLHSMAASWSYTLANDIGRLHLALKHRISTKTEENEIVSLDLTARGPIDKSGNFEDSLMVGHDSIVNTFSEITSETAHRCWGSRNL